MTTDQVKGADPQRRRADAPVPVRVVRFLLAPVVDQWKGVSLTRLLAIFWASVGGYAVAKELSLSANILWLAALSVGTAFGKSTFELLLARMSLTSTSSTVDETRRTMTEQITTRRQASDIEGAEPAP